MFKYILAASVVAAAQAQTCSVLTLTDSACPQGQMLADIDTMTRCKDYICSNLLVEWGIARGADETKKLNGRGYGCVIENWNGTLVTDKICMPDPAQCASLVYSRGTCPPGGALVDLDTLVGCKDFLCENRMDPFAHAHGSDKTKLLTGQSLGCELKQWNGEGQDGIICNLSPPVDCSGLRNVTGSCPTGMAPVGTDTLTSCSKYLCDNILGQYGLAHGEDVTKALVGKADGCKVVPSKSPVGYTICGAN